MKDLRNRMFVGGMYQSMPPKSGDEGHLQIVKQKCSFKSVKRGTKDCEVEYVW